jgi:glutamate/tyrosine decarboxylase-like PLP-dependent enzyme
VLPDWGSYEAVLARAHELAASHLVAVPEASVGAEVDLNELRDALGGELSEGGEDGVAVLDDLARAAGPGIVASNGPRYFGFVIGGGVPAAVGADWLTSAWDQNAVLSVCSPAAAVAEEVAAGWLLELLGLPPTAVVGFSTGAQMANFTGLAAARGAQLRRAGWDVEADGLQGAPRLNVVVGGQAHITVFAALRFLGLGAETATRVSADDQGRMVPEALSDALSALEGPTIVCAQAGEVNTGAFDPFDEIADLCERHDAWLHVDGAFGLWAAASGSLRDRVRGVERADSWATDAHKWLNVPYDSGLAIVKDREAVRSAMQLSAAYLVASQDTRDGTECVPEASRRARGFVIWAALRSLGRSGVEEMIERCCAMAERMAEELAGVDGVRVLNEVVLNQVLVALEDDADGRLSAEVTRRVQDDGTCWLAGTTWRGTPAIRISVSNWSTTEKDILRSADVIRGAIASARATVGASA